MNGESENLLRRFFDCWTRSDLAGALALVSDDAVFEPDLKGEKHCGHEVLAVLWGDYMTRMQDYHCEVVAVLEKGDLAMIERVETIRLSNGKSISLPILGVFRFSDQGAIAHWRDYWDTSMVPGHG